MGDAMTFIEKHRLGGTRTEHERLKVSWEGEIFGVGMFEAMAEIQPEHADGDGVRDDGVVQHPSP
jgi:hypothetical protein